jgi:hypothetical protein
LTKKPASGQAPNLDRVFYWIRVITSRETKTIGEQIWQQTCTVVKVTKSYETLPPSKYIIKAQNYSLPVAKSIFFNFDHMYLIIFAFGQTAKLSPKA